MGLDNSNCEGGMVVLPPTPWIRHLMAVTATGFCQLKQRRPSLYCVAYFLGVRAVIDRQIGQCLITVTCVIVFRRQTLIDNVSASLLASDAYAHVPTLTSLAQQPINSLFILSTPSVRCCRCTWLQRMSLLLDF